MLTPLELDIMKAVWRKPPITVRDVQESIRPGRHLAYTTVMTIMDRLYHKGSLKRTLQARTYLYEPAIDFIKVRDEASRKRIAEQNPMRTLVEPQDTAEAALFLASPEARFITGVNLTVNAGNLM